MPRARALSVAALLALAPITAQAAGPCTPEGPAQPCLDHIEAERRAHLSRGDERLDWFYALLDAALDGRVEDRADLLRLRATYGGWFMRPGDDRFAAVLGDLEERLTLVADAPAARAGALADLARFWAEAASRYDATEEQVATGRARARDYYAKARAALGDPGADLPGAAQVWAAVLKPHSGAELTPGHAETLAALEAARDAAGRLGDAAGEAALTAMLAWELIYPSGDAKRDPATVARALQLLRDAAAMDVGAERRASYHRQRALALKAVAMDRGATPEGRRALPALRVAALTDAMEALSQGWAPLSARKFTHEARAEALRDQIQQTVKFSYLVGPNALRKGLTGRYGAEEAAAKLARVEELARLREADQLAWLAAHERRAEHIREGFRANWMEEAAPITHDLARTELILWAVTGERRYMEAARARLQTLAETTGERRARMGALNSLKNLEAALARE